MLTLYRQRIAMLAHDLRLDCSVETLDPEPFGGKPGLLDLLELFPPGTNHGPAWGLRSQYAPQLSTWGIPGFSASGGGDGVGASCHCLVGWAAQPFSVC